MFGRNRKKEISPEDRVEQSDDAPVGESRDKGGKSEDNEKGRKDSAERKEKNEGRPDNPDAVREEEEIGPHRPDTPDTQKEASMRGLPGFGGKMPGED